jgi:ammonium transporter, Amt family
LGDTAWVLISIALVFLMTPGLGFFYGGMVRTRHVVSTIYQAFIAVAVAGLAWAFLGYSLAFSGNTAGLIGDLNQVFLINVGQEDKGGIPHVAFMLFQGMFAVISPALIIGAFAERVNFKAWLLIMLVWSLVIYAPVCHWVWGDGGWIAEHGGLDFAGGLVVHTTAGVSALVCAMTFGRRQDFGSNSERAYDTGFVVLGTGLLWFGWFGFNGGSALAANGLAAYAVATTFFAASAAMVGWTIVDWIRNGKPSAIGSCIGAVVGLVIITPAAGFVAIHWAILMGFSGSIICNLAAHLVRHLLRLDDTLDVFACHGIGGILGALMTGVFCSTVINPDGANGLIYGNWGPLWANFKGVVAVSAYSAVGTYIILKIVNVLTPIRVDVETESRGLDGDQHNEVINANVAMKYGKTEAAEITDRITE